MSEKLFMAALAAAALAAGLADRVAKWSCPWLPDSLLAWCMALAVTVGVGVTVWAAVKRLRQLLATRFTWPKREVKDTKEVRRRSRRSARRAAAAARSRGVPDTSRNSNSSNSNNSSTWDANIVPPSTLQRLEKARTALVIGNMNVLQYSAVSAAGALSSLSNRLASWAGVPPPQQQQQQEQQQQQNKQQQQQLWQQQQHMLQSFSNSNTMSSAFLRGLGSRNGSLQGIRTAGMLRGSSNGTSTLLSGYASMALGDGLVYSCCGSGPSGLSLRHSLQSPSCSMARQLSMFTPASSGSAGVPQVAHSEMPEHNGQVLVLCVDKSEKDQATVTTLLAGQSGGEHQSSASDAGSSSSEQHQGSTWGSCSSLAATTATTSSSGSRTGEGSHSSASSSSLTAANGVGGPSSRDFKVVCVSSGRAAIDWVFCAKHLPDIVLLDAALPDMSATEVCRVLRLQFSPLELPILLVSAGSGEADALAALDKGVNDFLMKPLRLMELQARINSQLLVKQSARREAEARSHYELLAQVLPSHIIHRLALGQAYAPEHHEQVTILFSDIVGFTELCSRWTTQEVVVLLDALFSSFDDICDRHGVFKVETIGDAYMMACGHGCSTHDHAVRVAAAAVDMLAATDEISQQIGSTVQIRIGMHTGHVLSGVVGKTRPRYCFFGDTVNVASRMESSGHPMTIHLSEACKKSMLAAAAATAAPAAAATQNSVELSLQCRRGSRERLSRTASVPFGRNVAPSTAAAADAAVLSVSEGGSLVASAAAAVAAAAKAEQPSTSSGTCDTLELTCVTKVMQTEDEPGRGSSSDSGGCLNAAAPALKPIRCHSPFQGLSAKPLPKVSDPCADAEPEQRSRFYFKLPAAAAAILSAVRNSSSSSSSRRNSNRAASGGDLPPMVTARSGVQTEGSGHQGSKPAEKVEGLRWEMFDLGFHQVKGKGLMKTHLLKVGKWQAALRTVKARQAAAAAATAAAPDTPTTQDAATSAQSGHRCSRSASGAAQAKVGIGALLKF